MDNRVGTGLFSLNGITGMLIATVLLLSILGFLVFVAVGVQAANATNFYEIKNAHQLKKIDAGNAASRVVVK